MTSHEVDPRTQASALPPTPERVAVGAVVEVEGAYYEHETPSPEQLRVAQLGAEDTALVFLDRATTNRTITRMSKGQARLLHEGREQEEQTRLGHAIERSKEAKSRFYRIAKQQFAWSRGIETEEVEVSQFIEDEGVEKQVKKVVAKNPEQQAELDETYKPFFSKYKHSAKLRKTRRTEIARHIAAIKAGDPGPESLAEVIYKAGGIVRPEHLPGLPFDPEQPMTMAEYIGKIGARMSDTPREDSTQDSILHVYGQDFEQARPASLAAGLYFPHSAERIRPKKPVVQVTEWYCDLDKDLYPGIVPFRTGVAVTGELYEAIVGNAPWFVNRIANRTEKVNRGPVVEKEEDLGGESALYGLVDKHVLLEAYDQELLEERRQLVAVSRSLDPNLPIEPRRVKSLEPYRLTALSAIQEMVRVACKGHRYGTNRTQNTLNAVVSEIHRSPDGARRFKEYTDMAIAYNDAVRGKINQSIHGIGAEIGIQAVHAINNIDRDYEDKPAKKPLSVPL